MAQVRLEDISPGRFTEATVRRMYELVDAAKKDEKFQRLIYGIVNRSMPGQWKDYRREIETVFNWFKSRHDYRRDPYSVELLQDVWATLDRKRFDCDDSSIFLAAAAEVLGAPSRMVTVSTHPSREPSHVFPEVMVGGQWLALDATVPHATVGWFPVSGITDRRVWTRRDLGLSGDDEVLVEGLGRMNRESLPPGWVDDSYAYRGQRRGQSYDGMVRWEGGFSRQMYEPTLPPDTTDKDGKTWAAGERGPVFIRRGVPENENALVHILADQRELEAAGGGAYAKPYPIMSWPSIAQQRGVIDSENVPMVLNPTLWTGAVPDSSQQWDYTLPYPAPGSDQTLVDLAGLGRIRDPRYYERRIERAEHRQDILKANREHRDAMHKLHAEEKALRDEMARCEAEIRAKYAGRERGQRPELKRELVECRLKLEKGLYELAVKKQGIQQTHRDAIQAAQKEYRVAKRTPGIQGLGAVYVNEYSEGVDFTMGEFYAADDDEDLSGADDDEDLSGADDEGELDGLGFFGKKRRRRRGWYKPPTPGQRLMGGLGQTSWLDTVGKLATSVVSGVTGGLISREQAATAVDAAVNWYQQKRGVPTPSQVAQQVQTTPPTPVEKAAFGAGLLVPIGIGVLLLTQMGGKKRGRRNPHRGLVCA